MDSQRPDSHDSAEAPPATAAWKRYAPPMELTAAALASVFIHVLLVALLVALLVVAMRGQDTQPVPIAMVDGGEDDSGFGSPGSEGGGEALAEAKSPELTPEDLAALPITKPLPEVRQDLVEKMQLSDPNEVVPLSDAKTAAYALLDEKLQNQFLNAGKKTGAGNGTGEPGQTGTGIGGSGHDSTRSRSARWVLTFSTRDGRDYLNQLKSLQAVVLIPVPPANKQLYIFRDLDHTNTRNIITETEWNELAGQVRFSDVKRESVVGIGAAMGLDFVPDSFWAFFPKGVENELARLEQAYRGLRVDQIAETKFRVILRNGRYEFSVASQSRK